jgi:hypothetical protein
VVKNHSTGNLKEPSTTAVVALPTSNNPTQKKGHNIVAGAEFPEVQEL